MEWEKGYCTGGEFFRAEGKDGTMYVVRKAYWATRPEADAKKYDRSNRWVCDMYPKGGKKIRCWKRDKTAKALLKTIDLFDTETLWRFKIA